MAFSSGDDGGGGSTTLSEINVTPLVDVMLVLLTIFMVTSSVETIQVKQEKQALLEERAEERMSLQQLQRLKELEQLVQDMEKDQSRDRRQRDSVQWREEQIKELEEELEDRSQNVPIELPKVNSEAVNLAEEKKIVVIFTKDLKLFIGDTMVLDCQAPEIGDTPESLESSPAFQACLKGIGEKLLLNKKLKDDGECYLKAERSLPYGKVLALMSTIRKAGITKFGLVSDMEEQVDAGK